MSIVHLLAASGLAATLEIDLTGSVTSARLDGQRLVFVTGGDADVRRVVVEATGPRRITVHPLFGSRELGALDLDLPATGTVALEWRDGALREVAPTVPFAIPARAVRLPAQDGLYMVPIRLREGGEILQARADTGATNLLLCEARLAEAGAEFHKDVLLEVAAAGEAVDSTFLIPRVELFGYEVNRVTVNRVVDCGLNAVGIEVLRQFSVVMRDDALWAWVGDPAPSGADPLPIRAGGAFRVPVIGPEGTVEMELDTGAVITALSQAEASLLGVVETGTRYKVPTARGLVEARGGRCPRISVAGLTLQDVEVMVMPGIEPGGSLLGMNVLSNLEVRVSAAGVWLLDPATSGLSIQTP